MSETIGTDRTDRLEAKPAWTRCPKCKDRLWNDRIDIEVHGQHCPADLQRALRRLLKALEQTEARLDQLERQPEPVTVELESGPILDFEHEAPWPGALHVDGPEDDDEGGLPEVPDIAASTGLDFEDEDEDDEDPASIRTFVR